MAFFPHELRANEVGRLRTAYSASSGRHAVDAGWSSSFRAVSVGGEVTVARCPVRVALVRRAAA